MTNETKKPFYKRPLFIATIIGIPIVLAVGCNSRHHYSHQDYGKDMSKKVMERVTKGLDLTEVQQEKLENLTQNFDNNRPTRNEDWSNIKDQWVEVISAETFDRAAFQQQWQQMGDQMMVRVKEYQQVAADASVDVADFIESLDVEQRTELADRFERFGSHRRHDR